jgi:hypothetical protein
MVGKLSDLFKKDDKKEEIKKTTIVKGVKKAPPKVVKSTAKKSKADLDAKVAAFNKKKAAGKTKKEEELMHSKTHQDLINVAYKAAEELKIAPWVLLRAAKWSRFTEDREKKYDGPIVDDIDTLDDAQKAALKKVLGL